MLIDWSESDARGVVLRPDGFRQSHFTRSIGHSSIRATNQFQSADNERTEPRSELFKILVKRDGLRIFHFQYGLTPLHMAAQSGHEGLVRMLLNQSGVQVDASTATMVNLTCGICSRIS